MCTNARYLHSLHGQIYCRCEFLFNKLFQDFISRCLSMFFSFNANVYISPRTIQTVVLKI